MVIPNRRRKWYISGRYRHYLANGEHDWVKMTVELRDEAYWSNVVAAAGHIWYPPVAATVCAEEAGILEGDEFVDLDLELMEDYVPGYDGILLRPGWRAHDGLPESAGARRERDFAVERGLLVIEPVGTDRKAMAVSVSTQLAQMRARIIEDGSKAGE